MYGVDRARVRRTCTRAAQSLPWIYALRLERCLVTRPTSPRPSNAWHVCSFSILDIADTIKGADDNTTSLIAISATSVSPAAAAVARLGIPEAASLQSMEALASLLLALPNSDHRKHRVSNQGALTSRAVHFVTAERSHCKRARACGGHPHASTPH